MIRLRLPLLLTLAGALVLPTACADRPEPMAPDLTPRATADEGRLDGPPPRMARLLERSVILGDVVHYRYAVDVGPGPFEEIRLHRVVREPASPTGRPARKLEAVMLLPGAPQLVEGIFMPTASPFVLPEEGSVAVFLASNDIDVWGVDYGWTALTQDLAQDFSFLEGWGMAKDAGHIATALELARWIRSTTGQGAGPVHVLGFSYGGFLSYAVAAADTRRPGNLRSVKGIIPVDGTPFKAVSDAAREAACLAADAIQAEIDAGSRIVDRSFFRVLGQLALAAPGEPSAIVPGFNNADAPLVLLISAGFLGGAITPPGVTLFYTHPPRVYELLNRTPPYLPRQSDYDIQASHCDSPAHPVGFDEHLGDIEVPILYIDRMDAKLTTVARTRSTDVTTLVVNPTLDPSLYGHADFFLADDAPAVIWRPILEWIRERG